MRAKVMVCGVHLLGEHYLTPEIPVVSIKPAFLSAGDRDHTNVAYTLSLCENNSIYV